ncbi:MAG: hypothetical protein J7K21_05930 [Desulfurococcales archaeon]|nr:hypothetical protein [Desulfurococcales archaeon]
MEKITTCRDIKPRIQPIKMKSALELWSSDVLPVAKYTWVLGPKKPRDQVRKKEIPPVDVGIDTLVKKGVIELLEPIRVDSVEDVKKIPDDIDAILLGDMEDWLVDEEILEALASKNKPFIAEWDNWGYSIHGRLSKLRFNRFKNTRYYYTMGDKELLTLLNALRGWRYLKTLRILYVGEYPPRSVAAPEGITFDTVKKKFGVDITRIDLGEYMETIKSIRDEEVEDIARKWALKYMIMDGREKYLKEYAKIYLGVKKLLLKHRANAITVECPGLPDIEYVPCFAFSILLDEGIPCGCEADIPTLLAMSMVMGVSGDSALMGNINENVTHIDIERGIVTINHDVVPPSYGCPGCRFMMRDYHNMGRGSTAFVKLPKGMPVTLTGVHWNLDKIWATKGYVAWTEDTVHCRISIGIKVDDAKKVSKIAFGHHIVLARGDHVDELRMLANILGLEFINV